MNQDDYRLIGKWRRELYDRDGDLVSGERLGWVARWRFRKAIERAGHVFCSWTRGVGLV